jgi:hypothetical protein
MVAIKSVRHSNPSSPFVFIQSRLAVHEINDLINQDIIVLLNLRVFEIYGAMTVGVDSPIAENVANALGIPKPKVVLIIRLETALDAIVHEKIHVEQNRSGWNERLS